MVEFVELSKTFRNTMKQAMYKSGELLILVIFFIIIKVETDITVNDILFTLTILVISIIAIWTISALWKKVVKLEAIIEKRDESSFRQINKLVKYIDRTERINDTYFVEYGIIEYVIKSDTIIFMSETFKKMFTIIHDPVQMNMEWLGSLVAFVNHEEACEAFNEWHSNVFYVKAYRFWFKNVDNNNILCSLFAIPKFDLDENFIGFKIYFRDITDEVFKDEALEGQNALIEQIIVNGVKQKVLRDSIEKHLKQLRKGENSE